SAHPGAKRVPVRFLRGQFNEGFRCSPRPGATLTLAESSPAAARRKRAAAARADGDETPGSTAATPTTPAEAPVVVVTETELFGRQRARRASGSRRATVHKAQVDQLLDFADLVEGDFVVHLQHGVAL